MEPPQKKRKITIDRIIVNSLSYCPTDVIGVIANELNDFSSVVSLASTNKKLHSIDYASLLTTCYLSPKKLTKGLAVTVSKFSRLSEMSISYWSAKKLDKAEFLLHLTTLVQLRTLRLFGSIQVDDIEELFEHLTNLQWLHLCGAKSKLEEWALFDHLTNLKQLTLQSCFEPIGFYILVNLEELVLDDNLMQVDDYYELNSLTNLTRLKLTQDLKDDNFERITSLPSLNELSLECATTDLTKKTIDFITSSMLNLTKIIWVTETPDAEQHSFLANITALHNLQYLSLLGPSPDNTDMDSLAQLSNLTHLFWPIPNNEIAQQILKLTKLKSLITAGDFDYTKEYFASAMPRLRELQVYGKNSPPTIFK